MIRVPLIVRETAGIARRREVVRLGAPCARGLLRPDETATVLDPRGVPVPSQAVPLSTWPDGSVKWLDVSFVAQIAADQEAIYHLVAGVEETPAAVPLCVIEHDDAIHVDTGIAAFRLPRCGTHLVHCAAPETAELPGRHGVQVTLADAGGRQRSLAIGTLKLQSSGPLCCRVSFSGRFPETGLRAFGEWTFFAGSALCVLDFSLHNPQRARHRRGQWDLGDPGSISFRSVHVELPLVNDATRYRWRTSACEPWSEQSGGGLEIRQHSSGGDNFASRTHVDRHGCVPERKRGFVVHSAAGEREGLRTDPIVAVEAGSRWLAAAIHEFWQQFPKSLELALGKMRVGIYPATEQTHELQAGEQTTARMGLLLGAAEEGEIGELAAVIAPLAVVCDHSAVASSGAVWRLPHSAAALRPEWNRIAHGALEGPCNFFAKRETADEYGWRNFGDLWADHEEAYYDGPRPIVSHYNNQYDALEAFLLCYLLTGDPRWWQLADPLARHTIDIDIYHTTQDRAAYNGGLFWHTNHYVSAATATHRSYSRENGRASGGPASEHNYTSGLLLYWQLTGNPQARAAVVGLAEWVLNMDDGRRHVLGLVVDAPTGLASFTAQPSYHGPGRGAGNSINALLDGWLASGRPDMLDKVSELVRRTIHPQDDVAALDLGNAELRWSYTVLLQSLVRMLVQADEFGFAPDLIGYARASLLHYARWMTHQETFYLDQPQQLEFPTETWAAQELRKANVLAAAALFADSQEGSEFRAKADWFYDRAWSTLLSFPTWHCTRPLVLALQLGLTAARQSELTAAPAPADEQRWSVIAARSRFIPQKEVIRQGLRSPAQSLAMACRLARVWRWGQAWRTSWPAQRLRQLRGGLDG